MGLDHLKTTLLKTNLNIQCHTIYLKMLKTGFKMEFIIIGSVFIILGAVIIYNQVKIMTEQKEQKKKLNRMKI